MMQIPTTSDVTDTELPGAFLAAVAGAAEAEGIGGLVTVSTALEEVYLVNRTHQVASFRVYMHKLSYHYAEGPLPYGHLTITAALFWPKKSHSFPY